MAIDINATPTRHCTIFCDHVNQFFSRFFCLALLIGQTHYLDYLLISYVQITQWWTIFIPDWTSIIIIFIYHAKSYKYITDKKLISTKIPSEHKGVSSSNTNKKISLRRLNLRSITYFPWGPFAWFVYGTVTSSKIIAIFTSENYGQKWKIGSPRDNSGMQTAIGLTSLIFFFQLLSNVHRSTESNMKRFLHEVSATVTIDLLDTMDLLEIMYTEEENHIEWNGHREIIVKLVLGIVVINMLQPVFPCIIVYQGWTPDSRIFRYLVLAQKVLQIVLVNIFFMSIRLVLWSAFREKFSAFIIKNVLMVGILASDIFSLYMEAHLDEKEAVSYGLKNVASKSFISGSGMEIGTKTVKWKDEVEHSEEFTTTKLTCPKTMSVKGKTSYV